METRIEIYKDELWKPLRLRGNSSIKYNSVINKVGKIESREISHTNTFSLPYIHENIETLGLNVFNTRDMAKALNTKYKAKYFVNDVILQEGFILINNSSEGIIKLNFIDESLGLIEEWGGTTFRELLRDSEANIPADYATAIDELRTYSMSKTNVLSQTSEVGSRGYNLALFPNNLNQIGDKFQLDQNDTRQDQEFNPYQSRPVFNAKAIFDLASETFGYTATYDDSIDWDLVSETYMTDSTEDKNEEESGTTGELISQPISMVSPYYFSRIDTNFPNGPFEGELWYSRYFTKTFLKYHPSISTAPMFIDDWVNPTYADGTTEVVMFNNGGYVVNYFGSHCVLTPNVNNGNVGTIRWMGNLPPLSGGQTFIESYVSYTCYKRLGGGDIMWVRVPLGSGGANITFDGEFDIDVTMDKVFFDNQAPVGAGDVIGVMIAHEKGHMLNHSGGGGKVYNVQVKETFLNEGAITFDDFGQYEPDSVDLTHGASKKTIKELISSLMHKEGILMNINAKNKTIKFFGYNHYYTQRENGNFYDWSDYLLKYNNIVRNTDYGTGYAKRNRVSLSEPFQGNFYDVTLSNQGDNSKYVDFTTNEVKQFKDVVNILSIDNSSSNDWIEYETKGFSLVEYTGVIDSVAPHILQARANGDWQGVIGDIPKLANVNYARLPEGLKAWYSLVDSALRVTAEFMIPLDVITSIDLSQPVYVEELNGYYIVEEISEYINGVTPVKVKLIKLEEAPTLNTAAAISTAIITTDSKSADSTNNKYEIAVYSTPSLFNVTTSTGYAKQLTNHPDDGGTYTGLEFTQTLLTTADNDLSTRQTIFSETSVTAAQEGWYEVYVEMTGSPATLATSTATTITSESQYAYLGDIAQAPELLVELNVNETELLASGRASFTTKLKNFADITDVVATCEYQKLSGPSGIATGTLRVVSIADLQEKSETEIAFQDGVGFYKVNFKTTEADSEDNAFGGFYIS